MVLNDLDIPYDELRIKRRSSYTMFTNCRSIVLCSRSGNLKDMGRRSLSLCGRAKWWHRRAQLCRDQISNS